MRSHHRSGYIRGDGTVVSDTIVQAHCRGNQKSYDLWRDSFKNGVPSGWPHKSEESAGWKTDEIEKVLETLDRLPDFLSKLKGVRIYRMKNSVELNNPGTSATNGAVIALYDSAFKSKNFDRVLAHELAHQLYLGLDKKSRKEYYKAAGAIIGDEAEDRVVLIHRSSGYVENDGIISVNEDFSNNIEYFIFEPKKLRKVTPKVYEYFSQKYKK